MRRFDAATVRHWRDPRRLKVLGTGAALPGPAVETRELLSAIERRFGVRIAALGSTIADKLGIRTRHFCRGFAARREAPMPGLSNPDLAALAVRRALAQAGLAVADLTYLIAHTTSPARLLPPNVSLVADELGFEGPYLELRQACTGFANALVAAHGVTSAAGAGPVAIVGSETGSVYFDPGRVDRDRGQLVNLVQMGDAAGAVIVAPDDGRPGAFLCDNFFGQIGRGRQPGMTLAAGGSDTPFVDAWTLEFGHDPVAVRRSGPELFRCAAEAASAAGVAFGGTIRVIPHQVNGRIAELLAPHLGVAPGQVFVNADRVGNTGSAAMWLALAELRPKLSVGSRVVALGAEATKYMFGGFSYVHG